MEDKQTRTAAAQKASIASFKDAGKADVAVEGWRANGRGRGGRVESYVKKGNIPTPVL